MNAYISFLKTVFNSKIGPIRFFKERRALKKSANFDPHYYSNANADLRELKGMPYLHYILFGRYESRSTCENYSNHFSDTYFYRYQLRSFKLKAKLAQAVLKYQPLISVILFAGEDLSAALLKNSLNSICSQWYNHFEICLAVDKKAEETLKTAIGANHAPSLKIRLNADGLADVYQEAKGEYIAIIRAGDVLAPDAFFEAVKQVNDADADFIYSDEDKINSKGKFVDPFFKGGFSYEMLLSHNYIGFFCSIEPKNN